MAKANPKVEYGFHVRTKIATLFRETCEAMLERDEESAICFTAMIAGEHPLLVGPPGTGKSFLLDNITRCVKGAIKFDYLLTRFTDPMELFGPIDITELKKGKCERIVGGMLPTCNFAFLDEIFKASSAILNTLLKILNERTFKYGNQSFLCPLRMCLAASNEFPHEQEGGKELGALFDRFLIRKVVQEIKGKDNQERLLQAALPNGKSLAPKYSQSLTVEEIEQASKEAAAINFSPDAFEALKAILDTLGREGVRPSSRRRFKSMRVIQSYAYLCESHIVEPEHLSILAHTLWDDPAEQPLKVAKVIAKIANPLTMAVADLRMQCEDVIANVFDRASAEVAAEKLENIQDKLEALKKDPKRDSAINRVIKAREANYMKITGAKGAKV